MKLLNNCRIGKISVFPANWNTSQASVKIDWRIQYRFYDPAHRDKFPKGKLCIIKGMNHLHKLKERQSETRDQIAIAKDMLINEGYNPISKKSYADSEGSSDIPTVTPLNRALDLALDKIDCASKRDIKSALTYIHKSAINLGYDRIPVSEIRRKHCRMILDNCSKVKTYWSNHLYNHYRSYLMMLFKQLVEMEAIENNPVNKDLAKKSVDHFMKDLLTKDEQTRIVERFNNDKYYLRFLQIFFHSGARPIELTRLTPADVDLKRMVYRVMVRKGKLNTEQERPIKYVALPYWKEILDEIASGQLWAHKKPQQRKPGHDQGPVYLFGKNLKPSRTKTPREYVSRKWQRVVKTELGIDKDLYSLKHSNLEDIAIAMRKKGMMDPAQFAADAAGHTTPVITLKHYLPGEEGRKHEEIRGMNNKLGG